MTRHEELLAGAVLGEIGGLKPREVVRRLTELGLLNRTACEQLSIRSEVAQLAKAGIPRCEALHVAARKFCCSYEKARGLFYKTYKS